jgi:hypothetical protein
MLKCKSKKHKQNQSGILTVDFIMALLISFGLGMILMAMSFTLTVVEVAQYAAYSAVRTMSAAHVSEDRQIENGRKKFDSLTKAGSFGGLFTSGWFELGVAEFRAGNGKIFGNPPSGGQFRRIYFIGMSVPLKVRILEINIPLIGKTGEEGDFSTSINAFLLREPSQDECFKFFESRKQGFRASQFPSAQTFYDPNALVRMEDNGC